MATTYTNMGLKSWNAAADVFSYTDLDANWSKVDVHDHSSGKGIQIPLAGLASASVDSSKIVDGSIVNADINASAGIVGTKLAASTVAPSNLTSAAQPNNSVYKTIWESNAFETSLSTATTYIMGTASVITAGGSTASGAGITPFYLLASDYAVTGLTSKIRIRVLFASNANAAGTTFTFTMNAVTIAGAANVITPTVGATALSASMVTPGASAFTTAVSADTNFPADGPYVLCVTPTGAPSGAHAALVSVQVQVRNT